jgi:L-ascorbate metabolism protein UlaG (beta-lactamase superfamily)
MSVDRRLGVLLAALAVVAAQPIAAQTRSDERCPRLVAHDTPRVIPAALRLAALEPGQVRLTFIGHSTFLIESPKGVKIATDYNDYVKPPVVPDIATMNRAHSTHYSSFPNPDIKYVLKGWNTDGGPARHELTYEDVWVRNVVTNIRDWGGGTMLHGNSIFVFELSGVCIAHLGHLHHTLTPEHIDQLGRIDVVLVPVDGTYTLGVEGMIEVLEQIKAPLMIPMHIFGEATLTRFLEQVGKTYAIERAEVPVLTVSRATLPKTPKMIVLPGR